MAENIKAKTIEVTASHVAMLALPQETANLIPAGDGFIPTITCFGPDRLAAGFYASLRAILYEDGAGRFCQSRTERERKAK
jgi:hypothetical protein